MKRVLTFLLVLAASFSIALTTSAEEVNPITVTLDGKIIDCESYGVKVEWDSRTRTVILTKNSAKGSAVLVEKRVDETDIPKTTF